MATPSPNTLLNYELRKVQKYDSSITGTFNPRNNGNILTLSNIASSVIDGLPIVYLNSLVKSQLKLLKVLVVPEGSTKPITITGLLNYMQQAIQKAYSNNKANNSVLYPFSNVNLYGQGIDIVQLTRKLAGYSVTTQGVNLGNFTYTLFFGPKKLLVGNPAGSATTSIPGCNFYIHNAKSRDDVNNGYTDTAILTIKSKVYYNHWTFGTKITTTISNTYVISGTYLTCATCNSYNSGNCPYFSGF